MCVPKKEKRWRIKMEEIVERLDEFREALSKLVENPDLFKEAAEAVELRQADRFQAVLSRLEILRYCRWICRWFCIKVSGFICRRFCPEIKEEAKLTIEEMLEFGKATIEFTENKKMFNDLLDAFRRQDVEKFRSILEETKMIPYCWQFCRWFAHIECYRICRLLCPPLPVITHVGNIPTNQIDVEGYADGPSQPPGHTDAPDVTYPAARGDHPFGGKAQIRGILNIANPDKYKVEYSDDMATWIPIMSKVLQYCGGYLWKIITPTPPPDPGWYNFADLCEPNYLTWWQTPSGTGKWYLRLTVRNKFGGEFESEIVTVRVDNERPKCQLQDLKILMEDGSEKEIKCGGIKKGEGKLVIRFTATDENFRRLRLRALGGCGKSIDIFDENTGTFVNRSYEGDTTDAGEPPWREVLWDPWKDPVIEKTPCCYLIVLDAWDRAIINGSFYGGHYASDHEAVQIAI